MNIRKFLRQLPAVAFTLLIAGCGGGGIQGDGTTGGTGTGGTGGTGDPDTSPVRIGHIDGTGSFQEGVLFVRTSPLAAGGNTDVVANLVDANGAPVNGSTYSIAFTSGCVAQDRATLTTPITPSAAGLASTTYTSKTCEGDDAILATVVGETGITATATVTVQPIALGTIQFDSASPTVIAPKGTGGITTGVVRFKVLSKGDVPVPVPNREVTFALDNTAGGLEITPSSISNSEGIVQAIVTAGTVITPIQIVASIADPQMSTTYKGMRVGSGSPDQDSFSISLSTFNPEAQRYDGESVGITIRLADVHNNRVPDGTIVAFITDGGSIDSSEGPCVVSDGACTVQWISQNPRPADGMARIIAYSAGDESFVDANGNGLFDIGETFATWDLGEPFIDVNGNDTWEAGEPFVDADVSGARTAPNTKYDGALCADRNNRTDCGSESILVWGAADLAMSDSFAQIIDRSGCPTTINVTATTTQTCFITVGDTFDNALPEGTTVAASVSNGSVEPASFTFPKTTGPVTFRFVIKGDATSSTGKLDIKTTTPKNNVTSFFDVSDVND